MKKTPYILTISITVLVTVLILSAIYKIYYREDSTPVYENTAEENVDATNIPEVIQPALTNPLSELKNKLESEISSYDGEWSVFVENLSSGDYIEINNKKMVSASLIKLFIMAELYNEVNDGNIGEEEISSDVRQMITISDNEASNRLVAKIGGGKYLDMTSPSFIAGMQKVNNFAEKLGCPDTQQQRDMKDSRDKPIPEQNYTSVRDCGTLLRKIYQNSLINEEYSDKMLDLLKKQTRRAKIPAALPDNIICANKTGELSDVENDAAIVFSPAADYILCVMSNSLSDTATARKNIIYISDCTYRFFNNAD